MQISIIIVSYNTRELLRNCICSILEKTQNISYEIIVVDNNSSDGSVEMLRNEFDKVKIIASPDNLGFGRANNLAVAQAEGEYVLFLNPDTTLRNNAVKILYDFLQNSPRTGACGGNLFDAKGKPALSFQRLHTRWTEIVSMLPNFLKTHANNPKNWFNATDKPMKISCISGADMMVRKNIIDQIGAFDPDFFMYYEDMELSMRIERNGWLLMSVPEAEITHLAGQSCTVSDRRLEMLLESKYIFYTKTHGKHYAKSVYHTIQVGYKLYRMIYKLTGNQSKRKRYDLWIGLNRKAWDKYSSTH